MNGPFWKPIAGTSDPIDEYRKEIMTLKEVRALHRGDEVWWEDPDNGACSRHYKILEIEVIDIEEEVVSIRDEDGSVLECFASELS